MNSKFKLCVFITGKQTDKSEIGELLNIKLLRELKKKEIQKQVDVSFFMHDELSKEDFLKAMLAQSDSWYYCVISENYSSISKTYINNILSKINDADLTEEDLLKIGIVKRA